MDVSIIIPTFNERENVRIISHRIREVMKLVKCNYEIFFVDDSNDDTPEVLRQLSRQYPEVRYLHRSGARGLGTAVVAGCRLTKGQFVVVMDADLQHPPELLPSIFAHLQNGTEVVIPSRFVSGGNDGGLNGFRKLVSWTARTIGRISLKRMRDISDCTGGFFAFHRKIINDVSLDPIGWKILMEILIKGKYQTVHEIPYSFVARDAGESKMGINEQLNYLRHVVKLVWNSPDDKRFYLFCLVGALGVFVNLISFSFLQNTMHAYHLTASLGASAIAMVHNFVWNDNLTWKGHRHTVLWRRVIQFPQFILISAVGIGITAAIAHTFFWLNLHVELGQLLGIVTATSWNFMANNKWTWTETHIKTKKVKVTQDAYQKLSN